MVWEIFSKRLQDAIKKRGFGRPTDIQVKGIPPIHRGEDILLIAETGSGKTESCLLPIFDKLITKGHRPITVLYITPLKSLNRDLLKRILWWANELGFDVSVRHGDTSQYERGMQAENPPHMLILTPETLQAVLVGSRMRKHLGNARYIIIDEIHELVNSKRGVQLSIGLERLKEAIKETGRDSPEFQIIGLSATIGTPHSVAKFLTAGKDCNVVNAINVRRMNLMVESPKPTPEDKDLSTKVFMGPSTTARIRRIGELIGERQSVLTFTNTRESSEILSSRLRVINPKLSIDTHHSSLSKNVRVDTEDRFKKGAVKSLVCTSSLELGIDIGLIDFILQYMSPRQVSKLTQRIGRSGHTITGVSDGVIIAAEPDDCFESAVIADHALKGKVEPTHVYGKSLDVLGHQIVGLSLDEYKIPFEKAYRVVKRAWPFRDLTELEFFETCILMQKLGFIWLNDEGSSPPSDKSVAVKKTPKTGIIIKRRRKAWEYYYRNLSTIPDTKNYQVFDVVSNQPVGTLDAEFMALHGSPGTGFIVKGMSWRILEVRYNKVMVEPMTGIDAAIPAWEGELIPVPFDVAQGVGRLRKEIANLIVSGKPASAVAEYLARKYPVNKNTALKMYKCIKAQSDFGFVPDDKNLLIEYHNEEGKVNVIIHSCLGSLINDTIGRVLSSLLMAKLGSIGLQTDPYRIVLKMQYGGVKDVLDMLKRLDHEMIETVIKLTLPNTELYRWRFLHVAQRFGIISRGAEFGPGYLRKIIESYQDLPPNKEALHEIFEEKLDLQCAKDFIKDLKEGRIKVKVIPGLSPLGKAGIMHRYEIMAPRKPDKEIFHVFKNRLLNTKVRLICCQCGWGINYVAKDLPKNLECKNCRARLLGVIRPNDMDAELLLNKYLKKKEMTKEENEIVHKILDTAGLVIGSGPEAVKVLAGRGIGQKTAARILRKQLKEDELLKEILREEQVYARNKRFWKE